MATILKVIDPAGNITEVVLEAQRSAIDAAPGYSYLLDGAGAPAPRILRVDGDLVIEEMPGGQALVVADFFTACTPDEVCTAAVSNFDGASNLAITPATQPLAALTEGSFLMFAADATPASLPTPPEEDNPIGWKPIAAGVGGLAIVGAGLAGGGGGGGDSTAPASPDVDAVVANNSRPVISGTAEPNNAIAMTITLAGTGERITYNTRSDANGNWSIDTATATPTAGALPAEGLPNVAGSTINVVATDTAGNISGNTVTPIVFDLTPPDAPTVNTEPELDASGGRLVLNQAGAVDGTVLRGQAEAGSTVTIVLSGPAGFSVTEQMVVGADGAWQLALGAADLPATDGGLAVQVTATDAAGNTSAATTVNVLLDRTLSDATPVIEGIIDNRPLFTGVVINGRSSNDSTPSVEGSISAPLAIDESLEVSRNGQVVGTATVADGRFAFVDSLTTNGPASYTVQLVDTSGNSEPYSMVLDTIAPDQSVAITAATGVGSDANLITPGSGILATEFTLTLTLSDVLAADETLQLYRASGSSTTALLDTAVVGDATDLSGQEFLFVDSVTAPEALAYQARVVDAAGNASAYTSPLLFSVILDTP